MSHPVQVPRHLLLALVALLALSLLGVGYLLGRQEQAGDSVPQPSRPTPFLPELIATATPAVRSLDERLDALEQRLDSVKQRSGPPAVVASPVASRESVSSGSSTERSERE